MPVLETPSAHFAAVHRAGAARPAAPDREADAAILGFFKKWKSLQTQMMSGPLRPDDDSTVTAEQVSNSEIEAVIAAIPAHSAAELVAKVLVAAEWFDPSDVENSLIETPLGCRGRHGADPRRGSCRPAAAARPCGCCERGLGHSDVDRQIDQRYRFRAAAASTARGLS
jgi:hypothetical protein